MTLLVKIKNKKAKRILEDLASLKIIEIEELKKKAKSPLYLASEVALAKTWDNETEDTAWKDL